jgi:phosphate-selective porin OprO/OprP
VAKYTSNYAATISVAAMSAALISAGAHASTDGIEERIRQLENLQRMQAREIAKLRKEAQAAKEAAQKSTNIVNAAAAKGVAGAKGAQQPPPPPPVLVTFRNGLAVETEDKAYSFRLGGRLIVDAGGSSQPERGYNGFANITYAWMQVEGRAAKIWEYKLSYDFANTSAIGVLGGIRDAYLVLKHPALQLPFTTEPVALEIGNQWEPMGLERTNTRLTLDFMDRSLMSDVFGAARHLGGSFLAHGSNWTLKAGVFSTSTQDKALSPAALQPVPFWVSRKAGWVSTGGAQYFDVSARTTYAPILEKDRMIHLGVSGRYHQPNSATGANDDRVLLLGSNTNMESNVLKTNLLGTPDLSCGAYSVAGAPLVAGKCVRNVIGYGAEFMGSYGPFSVQAEYMGAHYNRRGGSLALANLSGVYAPGGTSLNYDGYYVYGTWYLTGESRAASYSVSNLAGPATFEQIKILQPLSAGGWGAWELAARFSSVNLNIGPYQGSAFANLIALTPNAATRAYVANSSINGGREQDVTVGVNWYPDKGVRFMFNWTHVATLMAPWDRAYLNGAHPNTFLVRTQVNW